MELSITTFGVFARLSGQSSQILFDSIDRAIAELFRLKTLLNDVNSIC